MYSRTLLGPFEYRYIIHVGMVYLQAGIIELVLNSYATLTRTHIQCSTRIAHISNTHTCKHTYMQTHIHILIIHTHKHAHSYHIHTQTHCFVRMHATHSCATHTSCTQHLHNAGPIADKFQHRLVRNRSVHIRRYVGSGKQVGGGITWIGLVAKWETERC